MSFRLLSLSLVIVVFCFSAHGQWVQIGPHVGPVTSFTASGPRIFAGLPGRGILVSSDNGKIWTAMNSDLPDTNVKALAVSGINLLAGTSTGIFRSSDFGAHWTSAKSGLYIYSFGICGNKVYAAAADGAERVFLSTDSGVSWTAANVPFPRFSAIVQIDSTFFAGVDNGSVGGVYLSSNNGAVWTISGSGFTARYVNALAASGTTLFAGTESGIFRSTDQGKSWAEADTGLTNTTIRSLAISGTTLLAGSTDGIFRSIDNGATWRVVKSELMHGAVFALALSGTDIFAGTALGISVSTDHGSSWSMRCAGRNPFVAITALAVRGAEIFVATAWGGGSKSLWPVETCVFHSTDNGDSWVPQLTTEADAIIIRDGDVFVGSGMGSWLGKGVLRSTDRGSTWYPVNEGFPKAAALADTSGYAPVTCFASNAHVLFAGTHGSGVYSTTNDGVSWDAANKGLTNPYIRDVLASADDVLVATDSGVFRSTDNGRSWTASNEGFPPSTPPEYSPSWGINTLVASGTVVFAGGWFSGERGVVFRSTDHGTHWTVADTSFGRQISVMGMSGNNLFAGTWCCDSVYLSTDGGARWRSVGPTPGYFGRRLASNDKNVFWGSGDWGMGGPSGSGLFRRPLSEMTTTVDPVTIALPRDLLLRQNYPNPFNPCTTIQFTLVDRQPTSLRVYDILGREISTLVNEVREAGTYTSYFNGSRLASGVYFYRLQAGDFVQTKSLMLLK